MRRLGRPPNDWDGATTASDWDWPRSVSNQQSWESAFDEWMRRHGADFADFGEGEQVKRERANAEIRARAAAWEREKAEAAENKLRMERQKVKTEDARHARQAATLRRFWQTRSGVTWQDGVILSSFLLCVTWMCSTVQPSRQLLQEPATTSPTLTSDM